MRWWEELFRGEDAVGYRAYRVRQERGRSPALLVVDVVRSFVGPADTPLETVIEAWPSACGPAAHAALPSVGRLLTAARAARGGAGLPIVHIRPAAGSALHHGETVKGELAGEHVNGRPGAVEFVEEAAPLEGELVLEKPKASAFFDTPLGTTLRAAGVDSVVLAGATISGCIRATAVDAFSWGFRTFVVEDAVFDRSRLSAGVGLYELDSRYADVVPVDEAVGWFSSL